MYVVPFFTVRTTPLKLFRGIDLSSGPDIDETGGNRVSVDSPRHKDVFSNSTFLWSDKEIALETMFDEDGRKSKHQFTNIFYNYYNLPSFVKVVAFVCVETSSPALIGVRPVTPIKRILLCKEIEDRKQKGHTDKVKYLISKLKTMKTGTLEDLFPFVFQLYPIGGKVVSYKIFAICVAKGKLKTAFEVITNEGSNFICEVTNDSKIELRNRNDNSKMLLGD